MKCAALLVLLAACGGSSTPPPTAETPAAAAAPVAAPAPAPAKAQAPAETQASCEVLVDRFTALQADAILGEVPVAKRPTWKARIGEVVLVSCRDDRWPQAVLTCAAATTTSDALDDCLDGVQKPERELLVERLSPLVQAMLDDVEGQAPPR